MATFRQIFLTLALISPLVCHTQQALTSGSEVAMGGPAGRSAAPVGEAAEAGTWGRLARRSAPDDCRPVAEVLGAVTHRVAATKFYDRELEICVNDEANLSKHQQQHRTCCTRLMEHKLHQKAMDDIHETIAFYNSYLKGLLSNSTEQYRDEFLQVLHAASNATKSMLLSSFRLPTHDVHEFVDDLIADLSTYIGRQEVDIDESTNRFFDALFPSVYLHTLNDSAVPELTQEYRDCLMATRQDLLFPPFGLAAERLAEDLVKSFGVARVLLDAFGLAADVLNATDHAQFDHQCSRALTRLVHCAHCDGHADVRPCEPFCLNVMRGCLAAVAGVNFRWNLFVDGVERVATSMRGAYDIQSVMGEFQGAVWESITRAVDTVHQYGRQVTAKCGILSAGHNPQGGSPPIIPPRTRPVATSQFHPHPEIKLYAKIEMFIRNLADSKGFFNQLPDTLCSSERLSAGNYDTCWNGTAIGLYTRDVPALGLPTQVEKNPEMRVTSTEPRSLTDLNNKLDHMTKLLHNRITPRQPMQDDGRSSGSTDDREYQSGYGRYGWRVPEDDEDGQESGSSSGWGPPTNPPIRVRDDDLHSTRETNKIQRPGTDFGFEGTSKPSPYSTKAHWVEQRPSAATALTSSVTSSVTSAVFIAALLPLLGMQRLLVAA